MPCHCKVWNPWNSNGNSGMDAVTQANDIDKNHLSNGLRKQEKTCNIERDTRNVEKLSFENEWNTGWHSLPT